jgi:hypothetical protein
VIRLTDLLETPAPADEDSCPSWCAGGCDEDALHAAEYEGVSDTAPDTDVLARLMQDGDAAPTVQIGVNDPDEMPGSAAVRLSLEQARDLVDLLNDLITAAELG